MIRFFNGAVSRLSASTVLSPSFWDFIVYVRSSSVVAFVTTNSFVSYPSALIEIVIFPSAKSLDIICIPEYDIAYFLESFVSRLS